MGGDVVIIQNCKKVRNKNDDHCILETFVIDSGVGITPERQMLLFKPFLELKERLGVLKSQSDNIGLGLACSKAIC